MRRRFLVVSGCLLAATACGGYFEPVAATVGGREISFEDVEAGLTEFRATDRYKELSEQGDVEAIEHDFEQGYLAQLVRRRVLQPRANEFGIEITEADVEQQINVIKQDFPSEQAFQETLKEQALDEDALRLLVRDRLLEDSLRREVTSEIVPEEEELRSYYEENIDRFRQARVSHILVQQRPLARRLTVELRRPPPRQVGDLFARLARRHSQDQASASQGGDLGFASPDQFVQEFAEAMRTLPPNEISDPVRTEFGFHIIRVTARRTLSFEEVASQIAAELGGPAQDEAWTEWVVGAYEDADVDVNPRFGELDPTTGQIGDPGADDVPGAEAPPAEEQPGEESLEPSPPGG